MNFIYFIIASLIGAGVSVFFSSVPFLNFTNCLCCAPYWGGAILAVLIYRRLSGSLTLGQGVVLGLAIGLLATAASFLLSLLGLINTAELMNQVQSVVSTNTNIALPTETGYHFSCNCGIELIFCLIGGLIGGALFRTNKAASAAPQTPLPGGSA